MCLCVCVCVCVRVRARVCVFARVEKIHQIEVVLTNTIFFSGFPALVLVLAPGLGLVFGLGLL